MNMDSRTQLARDKARAVALLVQMLEASDPSSITATSTTSTDRTHGSKLGPGPNSAYSGGDQSS